MRLDPQDLAWCRHAFDVFADIGALPGGGVTRLGYSAEEDAMHAAFASLAGELSCAVSVDEAGNSWACLREGEPYTLIASHLDSVVEGGRYDGVAGVIAGLLALRWARMEHRDPPLHVAAFRCEESSNFGRCTLGSGLITGAVRGEEIAGLRGRDGQTLESLFAARGLSLTPPRIRGVRRYLELHIEQGRVLEEAGLPLGIVTAIAAPCRSILQLTGAADHSGATPMGLRHDALCAAAELVLAVERIGRSEAVRDSVATVGLLENHPNVMNVIPGEVRLGVDLRGTDATSLAAMEAALLRETEAICGRRGIAWTRTSLGHGRPVTMSAAVRRSLLDTAGRLGLSSREMPSGAGHDAMCFAPLCETGMVFIPCRKGISHNPAESASPEDVLAGARVLYETALEELL